MCDYIQARARARARPGRAADGARDEIEKEPELSAPGEPAAGHELKVGLI